MHLSLSTVSCVLPEIWVDTYPTRSFTVLCTEGKWVPRCYLVLDLFSYHRTMWAMEADHAERARDQQLSLTDPLLWFFAELLLSSITQSFNQSIFFILWYIVLLCYIRKCKIILTSHSNHSVKVRCPYHLLPHQPLCHMQAAKTRYWHLHSWQRGWLTLDQDLKLRDWLKKSLHCISA